MFAMNARIIRGLTVPCAWPDEGDNNVLLQQTASYMVAAVEHGRAVAAGTAPVTDDDGEWSPLHSADFLLQADKTLARPLTASVTYVLCVSPLSSHKLSGPWLCVDSPITDPAGYLQALRWVACYYVTRGMTKQSALLRAGVPEFHAAGRSQVYLFQSAARAYIEIAVVERFLKVQSSG